MKRGLGILLFILSMNFISPIMISEVEINPLGKDSGNEWIEFYSNEEIDLGNYKIKNNDGDELNLEGSFEGYYVYNLATQWLDNYDEKVFLYFGEDLIDETNLLEDAKNDELSWSFCDTWEFKISTKGENNCEENLMEEYNERQESEELEEEIEEGEELTEKSQDNSGEKIIQISTTPQKKENIEKAPIEAKHIKSEENNEKLSKSKYAWYGLFSFCLVLGLLFLLKNKKQKTEFED